VRAHDEEAFGCMSVHMRILRCEDVEVIYFSTMGQTRGVNVSRLIQYVDTYLWLSPWEW
jgi:hypothetical protein